MQKLFGTDGIRGEAGTFPLDKTTVFGIGRALARRFGSSADIPRFVIGRDTRESGGWIEKAFASGAISEGAKCFSAGVITTPGVAFLAKDGFDAGVVISASHNPFEDNGVKVFLPSGKKLDKDSEQFIERFVYEESSEFGEFGKIDTTRVTEFQKSYIDFLSEEFGNLSLNEMRIVIDCANGAASVLAPQLFGRLGADVVAINNKPDGRNINLNCGSLHLDELRQRVREEQADFGVAFDGDADRSLFVDEEGGVVDGDAALWVMAQHLKSNDNLVNDTVISTVMSNIGLEIALSSIGVSLLRTSVGDKYVLEKLLETGASIGGEQSGHIIFPAGSLVGDGMQTTLFIIEALSAVRKSLSEMVSGFTQYPQTLVNVRVKQKRDFDSVEEIAAKAKEIEAELGGEGRLLLRYSGTENLARVMIEGKDQAEIEEQANRLAKVIADCLG